MSQEMAKRARKFASCLVIVLACAISLIAFSQFRVRCELDEVAELFRATSHGEHAHAGHHHPEAVQSAPQQYQIHVHSNGLEHVRSHAHGASHTHGKDGRAQVAVAHHEHGPANALVHERGGSKQEEACCSSTGFTEFNISKIFSHYSPAFIAAFVQYVIAVVDLVDVSADPSSEFFAKLNAPPPLSPHIPTTILLI
jgi:hypothetical protein